MAQPLVVESGKKIKLKDFDASYSDGELDKSKAKDELTDNIAALDDLGYRLYAENRRALLLVLQGMDCSGKDGTIRAVMKGFNPQLCQVVSFKRPSEEELDHDFLWRVHLATPRKGNIGIFNRSHYEDVLVVRVHQLVPQEVWSKRYDSINAFEELMFQGGTQVVKIFLHISKEEQRERLQERIDDPSKRWKFNATDLKERERWDDYQRAYEDALTKCNSANCPWHIVPANKNWYRNLVVSRILRKTLEKMDPQYPPADPAIEGAVVQ